MKYIFPFLLVFAASSFTARGQGDENEKSKAWVSAITANAIWRNAPAGKYEQARSGFALYFSQAGAIRVPYLVYVPKSYDPSRATSLVVFLHGAILARDSFQYQEASIADEPIFSVGDTFNTLVVFPFARADFAWGRNEAANQNILAIISKVQQTYNVDKKRIYLGGISMGGNATYWFVNNKPEVFAGFYAFSSMPANVHFNNISPAKPLYTMNTKDDQVFSYKEVAAIYDAHKKETPGWHFNVVETGGHRFIYGDKGTRFVKQLLGDFLAKR